MFLPLLCSSRAHACWCGIAVTIMTFHWSRTKDLTAKVHSTIWCSSMIRMMQLAHRHSLRYTSIFTFHENICIFTTKSKTDTNRTVQYLSCPARKRAEHNTRSSIADKNYFRRTRKKDKLINSGAPSEPATTRSFVGVTSENYTCVLLAVTAVAS